MSKCSKRLKNTFNLPQNIHTEKDALGNPTQPFYANVRDRNLNQLHSFLSILILYNINPVLKENRGSNIIFIFNVNFSCINSQKISV